MELLGSLCHWKHGLVTRWSHWKQLAECQARRPLMRQNTCGRSKRRGPGFLLFALCYPHSAWFLLRLFLVGEMELSEVKQYVFISYHESEGKIQSTRCSLFLGPNSLLWRAHTPCSASQNEDSRRPDFSTRPNPYFQMLISVSRSPIVQMPVGHWDIFTKFIFASQTKPEFKSWIKGEKQGF